MDILLIADLILEMSVVGVFMKQEPNWYILAYPYFIHPIRGIIQTAAIFMVVAVATERYRSVILICDKKQANRFSFSNITLLLSLLPVPTFGNLQVGKKVLF